MGRLCHSAAVDISGRETPQITLNSQGLPASVRMPATASVALVIKMVPSLWEGDIHSFIARYPFRVHCRAGLSSEEEGYLDVHSFVLRCNPNNGAHQLGVRTRMGLCSSERQNLQRYLLQRGASAALHASAVLRSATYMRGRRPARFLVPTVRGDCELFHGARRRFTRGVRFTHVRGVAKPFFTSFQTRSLTASMYCFRRGVAAHCFLLHA